MDNQLNNIKNEALNIRLTDAEKSAMKARIFGVPSPATVTPSQSPYFFFSYQFVHSRILVPMAVFVVVFVSGSTAAAAQGALPGDVLYPVKVSINETVEVALAGTSLVAKAEVSAKLAERRVEEAEALAARGELTEETGHALAANFEAHAEATEELASQVEASDPAAATQIRTKLDSSLSAHSAILATLSGTDAEENKGADVVAAKVIARADTAGVATFNARLSKGEAAGTMMAMTMVAQDMATGSASTTGEVSLEGDMIDEREVDHDEARAAAQLQERAANALQEARKSFDAQKKKLATSTTAQVEAEFSLIDTEMSAGSAALGANSYAEAQMHFTEALKKSIRLYTLLKAQEKLERNIITPVLEQKLIIDVDFENEFDSRTVSSPVAPML
jgi:hypothetical protein